ncbi:MAG: thioredoxin family protein [Moheibacter sp.]
MSAAEVNINHGPVLAYFLADWCAPCDHMKPVLKKLKDEMGEKLNIVEINVAKDQMAAAAFKIRSVPTLILFKNGELLWKHTGQITADKIKEIIHQNIENG